MTSGRHNYLAWYDGDWMLVTCRRSLEASRLSATAAVSLPDDQLTLRHKTVTHVVTSRPHPRSVSCSIIRMCPSLCVSGESRSKKLEWAVVLCSLALSVASGRPSSPTVRTQRIGGFAIMRYILRESVNSLQHFRNVLPIHRITVTSFRCISMPTGFRRHLVGSKCLLLCCHLNTFCREVNDRVDILLS